MPISMAPHNTPNQYTMKKKIEQTEEQQELEIIKAVAQAWHGRSTTTAAASASSNEFDTRRLNFKNNPTRFKLEAMTRPSRNKDNNERTMPWDFRQSLWDSYELVAVSRRLETGLLLGDDIDESGQSQVGKRKKESKNSLRRMLSRTSRRFDE